MLLKRNNVVDSAVLATERHLPLLLPAKKPNLGSRLLLYTTAAKMVTKRPALSSNVKIHFCDHKIPPLIPALTQANTFHTVISCFFKTNSSI